MMLMVCADKSGTIDLAMRPVNRITSNRKAVMYMFLLAFIITGIVPDTAAAALLIPLCIIYGNKRGIEKSDILLSIGIGCVAGNDLTYFGGGDNIVAWSLLQKQLGSKLDLLTWGKIFWAPTFIGLIITLIILFITLKDKKLNSYLVSHKCNILNTILITISIVLILIKDTQYYGMLLSLITFIICKVDKKDFGRVPLKALYLWAGAYITGSIIGEIIRVYIHVPLPSNLYTLGGILIVLIIISIITSFMTNSGLTAMILPLTLSLSFIDNIWLFALVVKAIGLSYCTVFADGCLNVSYSYGLSQRRLFRIGAIIVAMQIAAFALYFYLMRGRIVL
jgi:di/tricarboxylate transporter